MNFERPFFQNEVQNIQGEKVAKIICPADDPSTGLVEMSWLGPKAAVLFSNY